MDTIAYRLPKIAPVVRERAQLQAWLQSHAEMPLRFVCAAAGSGKTTAAVLYARSRAHRIAYVGIDAQCTQAALYQQISIAAGLPCTESYHELLDRLAQLGRVEIIVDNIDRATPAVRLILERIYRDSADGTTFLFLARSSEALALTGGEAHGLVVVADSAQLAFDSDETALFVRALGLEEDHLGIARLLRATSGWAMAVAGVCRTAAARRLSLADAYNVWLTLGRRTIDATVADALREVPPHVAARFGRACSEPEPIDRVALADFARYGLFVAERDGRLLLNPLVTQHAIAAGDVLDERPAARAAVEMFGRFEFCIDGNAVVWQRRRDREIVQYLAMQPFGRATRAEIIACFWPEADRQLAAQSLRTACSTIRRAFAARVGSGNVARYFVAENVVELKLDALDSTVGRFVIHVERGDRAFAKGDAQAASAHYFAAETLYRAPLLAGEAPAAWTAPHVARLTAMHARCRRRIDELLPSVNSADAAAFRVIAAGQSRSA